MKAYQTRSPIHLYYQDSELDSVLVEIWLGDDTTTINENLPADYTLNTSAIDGVANLEIAELLRSKNIYTENDLFYTDIRDTAKEVLIKATLFDANLQSFNFEYNIIRIRDGYIERTDLPQVLKNEVSTHPPDDWTITGLTYSAMTDNPYGAPTAFLFTADSALGSLQYPITSNLKGVYTLAVSLKIQQTATQEVVLKCIGGDAGDVETRFKLDTINVNSGFVAEEGAVDSLGFDTYPLDTFGYMRFAISFEIDGATAIEIDVDTNNADFVIFNPTLFQGESVGLPEDVLLRSNKDQVFTNPTIDQILVYDKKWFTYTTNDYEVDQTPVTFLNSQQSYLLDFTSQVEFHFGGEIRVIVTKDSNIDECKFTPNKITFVNKFGVLEDIIFYKKEVETNVVNRQTFDGYNIFNNPNVGQKQVYYLGAQKQIKISSGFYPESYNTTFQQLQQSLFVWLNDEPIVVKTTSLQFKTRVNDKLIDYTMEFEYANKEVNNNL